jgi:Mn2+/Fe2+ NRAMP family transporter
MSLARCGIDVAAGEAPIFYCFYNEPHLMKEWVNPPFYNAVAWCGVMAVVVAGMTLALTGITIADPQ